MGGVIFMIHPPRIKGIFVRIISGGTGWVSESVADSIACRFEGARRVFVWIMLRVLQRRFIGCS